MKKPTLIAAQPVSAYEAKTHLPSLLERAEHGERFVITRHGKPVAQLIPFEAGDVAAVREAIGNVAVVRARLARKGVTLATVLQSGETARGLAHANHRY